MKISATTFILISASLIVACSTTKKTATASKEAPGKTEAPKMVAKSSNGIYEPGNDELMAIQSQYKETTLAQLKEGYTVYTTGACVGCHDAKNIYKRNTAQWKGIIDEMAEKARLSPTAKEAVYKYVLAIKASQAK